MLQLHKDLSSSGNKGLQGASAVSAQGFSTRKCLGCRACSAGQVVNSTKFFQPLVLELSETDLEGEGKHSQCPCASAAPAVSNYCVEFACTELFHPVLEGLNSPTAVDGASQPTSMVGENTTSSLVLHHQSKLYPAELKSKERCGEQGCRACFLAA